MVRLESMDGCPIQPGSTMNRTFVLKPLAQVYKLPLFFIYICKNIQKSETFSPGKGNTIDIYKRTPKVLEKQCQLIILNPNEEEDDK